MNTPEKKTTDEAQIRVLVETFAEAVRTKDLNKIMLSHAPNVVLFDARPPLRLEGSDAYRKNTEAWFSAYEGPIGFEVRDLTIGAGSDVAFSHSLNHVRGTMKDGKKADMWIRVTVCFRKIDGRWLVTHEHVSVPFETQTFKAALDLKP